MLSFSSVYFTTVYFSLAWCVLTSVVPSFSFQSVNTAMLECLLELEYRIVQDNIVLEYLLELECLLVQDNTAICRLRPLDAVLSSGLCGKEGALPPVTG